VIFFRLFYPATNFLVSIRVAQNCGFREWQRATCRGEPTIVFERTSKPM
jgi:RimJ/RimL family protein N-acetyltransferase